ncbi:MAG: bacterial Ig-like domain-containing protein [Candidatus Fimenecus sp.]
MTNTKITELVNQDNFINILKNELFALIDEELEKDTEMDCKLIDELVNAIETLEQCEDENPAVVLPLIFADGTILSKRIRNKVNGKKALMRFTAVAAAFAIILSGANSITTSDGKSVLAYAVDEILEGIGKVFGISSLTETGPEDAQEGISEDTPPDTSEPVTEDVTEQNNIDVEQDSITTREMLKIELITSNDFKTSYLWQEQLDLKGLKVYAVYSDGSRKEVNVNKCEISGFNSLKIGEQTVTVEYNGFTASFKVIVSRTEKNDTATRIITNVECTAAGKDIVVPMGTENPAVYKNVKWRYVYSDGTFSNWTSCEETKLLTNYNSQLLDTVQVLTYQAPNGMQFTVNVLVYDNTVPEEKEVIKLEVYKRPQAMKYYASDRSKYYTYVDSDCDFGEFQIKVYYDDKSNEIKTLADGEIQAFGTMSTDRPSSYNGYTITFAYGDVTLKFNYDVIIKPEIHSYRLDEYCWQTYYVNDAPEEFPTGGIVIARMNDSNKDIYLDVEAKGYDPNKIGPIELELYYDGEYLCDYVGGYIYGDTGYAVISRPVTDGVANAPLNFRPYVTVAKCVGDGKFETYGDIKYELSDNPVNDPSIYFESGTDGELKAMGITSYKCNCTDSATVYYTVRADEYITEFGTHEAKVYLYNVTTNDNGWTYQRESIAQDLSYSITIKEKPSYYRVEVPSNIKINIQDIYSEFYDKVHVYAVYKDGREEEFFDYDIRRVLPSAPITSGRLYIPITCKGYSFGAYVYVYSDGYEDSFYITAEDTRNAYDNYYSVGTKKPFVRIKFSSASQEIIYDVRTTNNNQLDEWDIEGWDTSTPGEKEAVITLHTPIGDFKTTYKYIVISEYNKDYTCSVVFNDGGAYDCRYGLIDGTYKVIHTDLVGRTYEVTDYTVTYSNNNPIISYINPNSAVDSSNPTPDRYKPIMKTVGKCENIQAVRLEDGNIKISFDCPYYPKNGTMLFKIGYPAEKTNRGIRYEYINSSTPEVIISPEMLCPGMDVATFYVYAYIVDDETGKEYRTYTNTINLNL